MHVKAFVSTTESFHQEGNFVFRRREMETTMTMMADSELPPGSNPFAPAQAKPQVTKRKLTDVRRSSEGPTLRYTSLVRGETLGTRRGQCTVNEFASSSRADSPSIEDSHKRLRADTLRPMDDQKMAQKYNVGHALMKKMGWQAGESLGSTEAGQEQARLQTPLRPAKKKEGMPATNIHHHGKGGVKLRLAESEREGRSQKGEKQRTRRGPSKEQGGSHSEAPPCGEQASPYGRPLAIHDDASRKGQEGKGKDEGIAQGKGKESKGKGKDKGKGKESQGKGKQSKGKGKESKGEDQDDADARGSVGARWSLKGDGK